VKTSENSAGIAIKYIFHEGVHLSEEDLLPPERACVICGFAGERRPVLVLQRDPTVELRLCRCGCRSASRMPKPEVLAAYYANYYSHGNETGYTFDGSARFGAHLLSQLKLGPVRNPRILDFGGGIDAALSRSLATRLIAQGAQGVEIALVDYNADCKRDWGKIMVDSHQSLDEAGEQFDVVIASGIIEHIPYPHDTLLQLLHSLRPGGRAYFRTPAMSPVVRLAERMGIRLDFTFPAHVHDLGQAFWENVLQSLGADREFELMVSRPSIVETTFRLHPVPTVVSHIFKLPWYLLRSAYTLVGGWEAVISRSESVGQREAAL
jgi:2-polyprenyl-3-methyl-5-hydroxy-6-metoxy-1,4-benzoquinol methylase